MIGHVCLVVAFLLGLSFAVYCIFVGSLVSSWGWDCLGVKLGQERVEALERLLKAAFGGGGLFFSWKKDRPLKLLWFCFGW